MKYFIFRHGETYNTKNSIDYDDKSVVEADILPESIPVIKNIARFLSKKNIDYCVSSPLKRCRQTTKIIEENTNYNFAIDQRITEYYNESVKSMVKRLKDFLEEIDKKGYSTIAICSHGEPVSALVKLIVDGKFTIKDLHKYPQTGVVVVVENNKVTFKNFRKEG
jgi:broad specificity phosphatase PhoE